MPITPRKLDKLGQNLAVVQQITKDWICRKWIQFYWKPEKCRWVIVITTDN